MSTSVLDSVLDRLDAAELDSAVADLVLASLLDELPAALDGKAITRPKPRAGEAPAPAAAWIQRLVVRGFRGIGEEATLELPPGRGLTVILGRNGSGKSSFSEALELLLTGDNRRWSGGRAKLWRDGWRNLHFEGEPRLEATLLVEGSGPTLARRCWASGAELDEAAVEVLAPTGESTSLDALGWAQPMSSYRPFLSYNELGSMLDEGPSKLFDRLSSILGVEELSAAAERLKQARLEIERRDKAAKATAKELAQKAAELAELLPDERPRALAEALSGRSWDLDRADELVASNASGAPGGALEGFGVLAALELPDADTTSRLATGVRETLEILCALLATDAPRAESLADLLERALQHLELHCDEPRTEPSHAEAPGHDPADCPVCGAPGRLDEAWRERTAAEIERLRRSAAELRATRAQVEDALDAFARALPELGPITAALDTLAADPETAWAKALREQIDESAGAAARALDELRALQEAAAPPPPEPSLESRVSRALDATESLTQHLATARDEAEREQAGRDELWQPLAGPLAEWLPRARQAVAQRPVAKRLKAAETWLRETAVALRNERFQPIKDQVIANWEQLRTRSHVELADVRFAGKSTNRRIEMAVTVDGEEGVALGVMSQGELHALALSLFLPRATVPDSPFRFLVIDDPVQAMDPARVDGLARLLEGAARERQVLVLTHDDRLAEAVRRLEIDAAILEVERDRGSRVRVVPSLDPIEKALAEARALVRTTNLDPGVVERVVPGLCRLALEHAAIEAVRRRRLGRGDRHRSVDEALAHSEKLLPRLALALFDDGERAGEVLGAFNNRWGSGAGDAVVLCNRGAHEGSRGISSAFVQEVQKLTERIRSLA